MQANSIVEATKNAWNWQGEYVGLVLVVLTAVIIFGGVKRIATISSSVVPMIGTLLFNHGGNYLRYAY